MKLLKFPKFPLFNDKACDRLSSILEKTGIGFIGGLIAYLNNKGEDANVFIIILLVAAAVVSWGGSLNYGQEVRRRYDSQIQHQSALQDPKKES